LENTWARQRFRPIGAEAAYRCGGGARRLANAWSQSRSGSRSPALANSIIILAIISGARSSWFETRRAARVISNATPMMRLVSGSNWWPSIPAASFWRMRPSQPHASPHSRVSRGFDLPISRLAAGAVLDSYPNADLLW